MKGFIASVITLCLLIGLITWNGIWIHKTTASLLNDTKVLARASADDRVQLSEDLYNKWKKHKRILAVTVSHTEIETIDSRIVSAASYARDKDDAEFGAAVAQLREDLEFLHHSESFTLEGII